MPSNRNNIYKFSVLLPIIEISLTIQGGSSSHETHMISGMHLSYRNKITVIGWLLLMISITLGWNTDTVYQLELVTSLPVHFQSCLLADIYDLSKQIQDKFVADCLALGNLLIQVI